MAARLKSSKLPTKKHKKQNGFYETLKKFSCTPPPPPPPPHRIFQPSQTFPFPFLVALKVKTTSLCASLNYVVVWLSIHCKGYSIFCLTRNHFTLTLLSCNFIIRSFKLFFLCRYEIQRNCARYVQVQMALVIKTAKSGGARAGELDSFLQAQFG